MLSYKVQVKRATRIMANVLVALAFTWHTVAPAVHTPDAPYNGAHMNTH